MKNRTNRLTLIQTIFFIGALFITLKASQDSLPIVFQHNDENSLCWLACCQMILKYYQAPGYSQSAIMSYATNGLDIGDLIYISTSNGVWYSYDTNYVDTSIEVNVDTTICDDENGNSNFDTSYCNLNPNLCSCYETTISHDVITRKMVITTNGPYHACNAVLNYFGGIQDTFLPRALIRTQLTTQISAQKPVLAGALVASEIGHGEVISGYHASTDIIIYEDPLESGTKTLSYDEFVNNEDWEESLSMTTTPPGIGVLDYVKITSGPMAFTYPGSSGTYQCQFTSGESPLARAKSFFWIISFNYLTGSIVVDTATTTGTNNVYGSITSWTTPVINLPSGYQWVRDNSGLVQGKVFVSTTDSDGDFHSVFELITYAEQNPYPNNNLFENQTVSSSHADVKAHDAIQIINDQITSAGVINFKTGQNVYILPETQILPGSNINVTIDPNLQ
jgi:Papain-like cysteine protease AvrRpt2